ncbi:hypothetical protein HFV02_08635 [Acidithiobacillus caldus]|uniref:hypothetical protein n=1 Tax=Acidithiobacillus caldus TaxID=33059 RepID=UPI001C072055|nr:hypothetical protein [Acidithiobacillus caldus]MBU2802320.1 hypothetical protein [Acidithiobacillus caldus]
MAFRSIIDIDVNDEKFSEFLTRFEKFSKDAKDIPEPFQKMDRRIEAARDHFSKLGGHLKRHMRESAGATRDFTVELHHAGQRMATLTARVSQGRKELSQMGETGRKTFGIIARAGKDLFSAIPLIGGAAAGAGLAAVELYRHQSNTILDRYKTAKIMNMTPGQVSAVDTQFRGILVNPAASLAEMRQAQFQTSAISVFSRAVGQGWQHMTQMQRFDKMLVNAKKIADTVPSYLYHTYIKMKGMRHILSPEDFSLLKRTSWATLNADFANAHKQAAAMNFSKATGRDMTKLAITISQKEVELSTDLSRTLAKGAPMMNTALNKLVNSVDWAANRINAALKGMVTGKAPTHGQGPVIDTAGKVYNAARHGKLWSYGNAQAAKSQAWMDKQMMDLLPKETWLYRQAQKSYQMETEAEKRYMASVKAASGPWYERIHNPMDIEAYKGDASYLNPGNGIRYARFASNAQAYQKAAQLVQGYGLHTLAAIAQRYTGSAQPTRKLDEMAKAAGISSPTAHLSLSNPSMLAKIVEALRIGEQPMQRSPQELYQIIKRALIDAHRETNSGTPASSVGAQIHMAAH